MICIYTYVLFGIICGVTSSSGLKWKSIILIFIEKKEKTLEPIRDKCPRIFPRDAFMVVLRFVIKKEDTLSITKLPTFNIHIYK